MRKQISTIFAAMMMGILAMGQPTIVRIDTVMTPYFQFDYEDWVNSDPNHLLGFGPMGMNCYPGPNSTSIINHSSLIGDELQYNYIEGGAYIYGIAVWLSFGLEQNPYLGLYPGEYLYLYDATPDSFVLKEQVALDVVQQPTPNSLSFPFTSSWMYGGRCDSPTQIFYTDAYFLYAHYFETPVYVEDSFYVGASYRRSEVLTNAMMQYNTHHGITESIPPSCGYDYVALVTWAQNHYGQGVLDTLYYRLGPECWAPPMKIKQRWLKYPSPYEDYQQYPQSGWGYPLGEWVYRDEHDFFAIVPIIARLDTITTDDLPRCREVSWFMVRDVSGDTATLHWQAPDEHTEWQISYGPKGIDPEDGTIVTCNEPLWTCADTSHRGDTMMAWVRTVCRDEDYERFSDWSYGVEWCSGNCSNEGIELPEGSAVVDAMVQLSPNPASGEVTVRSNYLLKGLEVYTQRGELFRTMEAEGLQSAFSVQGWPQGSYIVAVHTAAGTTAKKLLVRP